MNFEDFNISSSVLKAIEDMGFEKPTPIQKMAIPIALKSMDITAQAQTGSGKPLPLQFRFWKIYLFRTGLLRQLFCVLQENYAFRWPMKLQR